MSPEYLYPTAVHQLSHTLNEIYQQADYLKIDKQRIFIGGNSAGAQLAAQLAGLITNKAYAHKLSQKLIIPPENIKGLLLYNGLYNLNRAVTSGFPMIHLMISAYIGQEDYENTPQMKEIAAETYVSAQFPPCFLTAGNQDPLFKETEELIKILQKNKISVHSLLWGAGHNLGHDYAYDLTRAEGLYAFTEAMNFLKYYSQKSSFEE